MSKQFILNSICVLFLGAFVGYSVTHWVLQNHQGQNEMASLVPATAPTLTKLASHQIYQDYFDVRIKHEVIAQNNDRFSIVKAIVTAKKDLPATLSFHWKLGQDVTSSSPDLVGVLPAIKQGEKAEVSITVYGFHKSVQSYLSFSVSGNVDNHILTKETLSSSRPEDSFEYVVQQQEKLEEETSVKKIGTKSIRSRKFDPENVMK